LDLAHLTVLIEDEYGVDIFEESNINTISDILNKINE
jgi:acyl carrier protein